MGCLKKHDWNNDCLRLLLVEDSSILQLCLSEKLKLLGCEVVLAKSGEEAVEKFSPAFDGVLMDLGLPGMSGYDATLKIRKKYSNLQTQIIASTTQDALCEKLCRQVGMDGFLQKPWNEKQVTTFLSTLERRHRPKNNSYLRVV
jgi:CheY-like chemotaxis protein